MGNKPRGGQKKHWAEKARVQAWYTEIKRRSQWTDYALNYEFAWTEEGCKFRSPTQRPRTFEWIRKESRAPQGRDKRWRSMGELVIAVEKHPLFKGTQAIYDAEIWDLLQDTSPTPDMVQRRIDRILEANRLRRLSINKAFKNGDILKSELGLPYIIDRSLLISLQHLDRLQGVTLVWLLYLQTEPSQNANIRVVIEAILDVLLDHFFADFLPERHLVYYTRAISILLRTRLNLASMNMGGYGYIETIGTWPVVPEELIGKLTKADLTPRLVAWSPDLPWVSRYLEVPPRIVPRVF